MHFLKLFLGGGPLSLLYNRNIYITLLYIYYSSIYFILLLFG